MKLFSRNLLMTLTTFVLLLGAFSVKAAAPLEVEGATTINTEQAQKLWLEGAAFLDPRTSADWEAGHIPKAIHLNRTNPAVYHVDGINAVLKKDQSVVVYCNGIGCLRSSKTAADLVGLGYQKVYYYREGFPAWTFSGHPVE